jgi:hypothetical protein
VSLIKKMRKQPAVWWASTGKDEFGVLTFAEPVQIKCRWDDSKGRFQNSKGFMVESKGTVYVDREMNLGDKLKKGELDTDTPESPLDDLEAFEIQGFESNPNFKAKEFLYTAHL